MTPLLLDTIVLLWWLAGNGRLGLTLVHRIKLPTARVYVSVASAREICDLERLGLVTFDRPAHECLPSELCTHRFEWLPIDYRHVFLAETLQGDSLDMYDRLILAQAAADGLELATANPRMRAPGVRTIDATTPDRQRASRAAAAALKRLADSRPAFPRPGRPRRAGPPPDAWEDAPMDRPVPTWNAFPWGGTVSAGPTNPTNPTNPAGPTSPAGAGGEGEPSAEQRRDAACARQLRILMDGVSALGPGEGNST